MTFTSVVPFIVFIALNGAPQNSVYDNAAHITFYDEIQCPVPRNNANYTSYFADIKYSYNFDLYYDNANSYRLDFLSVEIDWYNRSYQFPNTYDDHWQHTFDIIESYNYDTISNFVPKIKFYFDYEDDLLRCDILNGNTSIAYGEYDSDCSIGFNDEYIIIFDTSYFTNSINSFMDATGDYSAEYNNGYDTGYINGYDNGYSTGAADGYSQGFNAGVSVDDTAIVVFNGILNIALVPINFFLAIFNFEILGINMSALVTSLLSICLIIIVVRFVTGKSQSGGK